jgi:Flp pilus assembly protein TadG
MVEFSLVVGIALAIIVGLIAASLLFYQRAAIHDGSTAGARVAALQGLQGSLLTPDNPTTPTKWCESASPILIEQAVATAAPQVAVNAIQLCTSTLPGATQLTQASPNTAKAIVTVNGNPYLAGTDKVTVTVTLNAQGLGGPLGAIIAISTQSTVPVQTP